MRGRGKGKGKGKKRDEGEGKSDEVAKRDGNENEMRDADGDGMIAWVLSEVGGGDGGGHDDVGGNSNGLTIETLFSNFEDSFANGDSVQLWQRILQSTQLEIGDDAKSRAALSKLGLSDVLALGLGSKLVKIKTDGNGVAAVKGSTRKTRNTGGVSAVTPETPDLNPGLAAGLTGRRRTSTPKKAQNAASLATRTSSRGKRSDGTTAVDDAAVQDAAPSSVPETTVRKGRSAKKGQTEPEQEFGDEAASPLANSSKAQETAINAPRGEEPQLSEEIKSRSQRRASTRGKRKAATSPEVESVQLPETPSQVNAIQNVEQKDAPQPNPESGPVEESTQTATPAGSFIATTDPPKKKRGRPPGRKSAAAATASKDSNVTAETAGISPDAAEDQSAALSANIAETPTPKKKQIGWASRKKNQTALPVSTDPNAVAVHNENTLVSPSPAPSEADNASTDPPTLTLPVSSTTQISSPSASLDLQAVTPNAINTQDAESSGITRSKRKRATDETATDDKMTRKKGRKGRNAPPSTQEQPQETPHIAMQHSTGPPPHDSRQYHSSSDAAQPSLAQGVTSPGGYMNMHFRTPKPYQSPFSAPPGPATLPDRPVGPGDTSLNAQIPNILSQPLAPSTSIQVQNSPQTTESSQAHVQRLPGQMEQHDLQRQRTETLMRSYKSPFAASPTVSPYSQPVQSSHSAPTSSPRLAAPSKATRPSAPPLETSGSRRETLDFDRHPNDEITAGIKPEPAQSPETRKVLPKLPDSLALQNREREDVPSVDVEAPATPAQSLTEIQDPIQPSLKFSPHPGVQTALPGVGHHPDLEMSVVQSQPSAPAVSTAPTPSQPLEPLNVILDPESQARQDALSMSANKSAKSNELTSEAQTVVAESLPQSPAGGAPSAPTENSTWALQRQQASAIHTSVAQAQAIFFPEHVTRLAAYYNEGPGNLILSDDKIYLQFIGIGQFPPQLPAFTTRISQLAEDPIISIRKGAKTDNLQIRVNDGTTVAIRHVFKTVHTDDNSNGVNEMREKIINARLFIEFNGDQEEAELALKKPFKCNKCGLRLKNKNGLEYHLTKAATICNPNFDPSSVIGKAKKRGPQPKLGLASESPKPAVTRAPKKPKSPKTTPSRPRAARAKAAQKYVGDGSSSSSEDSIMEWAASVATQGVESKPTTAPLSTKKYRALPGETALLERLAEDLQSNGSGESPESERDLSTPVKHFTQQICEEVLIKMVEGNNGIFPGDRGIWYGLFGIWIKEYPSLAPPESKLCYSVLDELVGVERLKRVDFQFPDIRSRITTRSIYLIPQLDIQSPMVEMMKELIRNTYPRYYVPSQFAPPAPIHNKLEALDQRTLGAKPSEVDITILESSSSEASVDSEDRFGSSSGDEDGNLDETGDPSTSAASLDQELDMDSDAYLESTSLGKRKRNTRNTPGKSRAIDGKSKGSNNIAKWHARRKREEKSPFPRPKNKTVGAPRAVSRKKDISSGIQVWATAPSYLPNPESGAWNTVPVKVDPPKKPRENYRGRLMAEPITFLQGSNGAWSQRPFGHGARPIYSRPLRRVDGNPNQQNYLSRIQNGHRPVLYPPIKNQMHFPTAPSKRLLRTTPRVFAARKSVVSTPIPNSPDDEDSEDAYVPDDEDAPELSAGRRSSTFSASASSVETESLTDDPLSDGPPAKRTRRAATTYGRSKLVLDEVQIVNFYEPRKLEPGGPRNPGLDSMPSNFGLLASTDDISGDETHQKESHTTITFVQSQIATLDSSFDDGSWTTASSDSAQPNYTKVTFDPETTFDVENLPYHLLTVDDSLEESQSAYTRSRVSGRNAKTPSKARHLNLSGLQRLNTSRFMTALPIDFRGVLKEPSEAVKDFGVQVANQSSAIQSRKRFRGTDELSSDAEARFIVFVVVIRTVTGGLDQLIDWVLVSMYYPDHSINYLNKLWNRISAKKKDLIEDLVVDFQDAFLVAYNNRTVPQIDFDDLVGYNWAELVDWAFSNIDTSLTKKEIQLPARRKDVEKIYRYKEHNREDNDVQETYFGLVTAVYKRMEAATSVANSIPVLAGSSPHEEISDFMIAKSCARAAALTPQADWNASVAKAKLAQAGLKLVGKAMEELTADKVISKRAETQQSAGRSYEEGDALTFIGKKHIQAKALAEAQMYKQFLDAEFRSGKSCVRADYMGNEGSYMCVTSLMALGNLKLVGVDIPKNRWGLGDEHTGYETKKIPKSRLRWEMDMYPTDTYVFDDDNTALQTLQQVEPPRGSQAGEIPIWYGITGALIPLIWCKVLVSVSGLVALRSGITTRGLKKALKPVLEAWEIRLLLEWGTMMGIFQKLGQQDGIEGWGVGENWWILVGSVCAGQVASLDEVKAVGEKEEDSDDEELTE